MSDLEAPRRREDDRKEKLMHQRNLEDRFARRDSQVLEYLVALKLLRTCTTWSLQPGAWIDIAVHVEFESFDLGQLRR